MKVFKPSRPALVGAATAFLLASLISPPQVSSDDPTNRGLKEQYLIDIYKREAQKIVIAIAGFPSFQLEPGGENLAGKAASILSDDLKFSGIFDVLDPSFLPFEPKKVKAGEAKGVLPALNALKVQALAIGELKNRGRELILEGRLFDVARGEMVFGKRYVGDSKSFRRMIHRFADEIVYRLTGEKGIAQTRIAFVSEVQDGKGVYKDIYVMDYDGYEAEAYIRVRGDPGRSINLSPRFSPDGRFLAYTSYRDGNPDLFLLDLETGRRQKLSAAPGLNISPAWSPDGSWIVFSMSGEQGTHLYLVRQDGSELRKLTTGLGINVSPTFSPNGRQIAFVSDRGGSPQIYVMDVEGTNVRRLTFSGDYNVSPRWSPRGDKIAFVSRRGGVLNIFIMNPDGSDVQQLTFNSGNNEDPTWSPSGRHLIFTSDRNGRKNLYVMNADGSEQRRLTNNGRDNYLADWSP